MANEEHLKILQQGVVVWNQWRKENPEIKPDLSGAYLFGVDLSGADLFCADLRSTYLSSANLTGADLTDANLMSSDLTGVNFMSSDLTDANLINANLKRVQALGTDFAGANLTSTCIEDWHINSRTNLHNVKCDYVYLAEIYSEEHKYIKEDRRPHDPDKIFAPGEFSKLFQKVHETVDLIFSEGIDWQAFLVSFNKLQIECDSDELSINSFENKGNGAFVIRVNVPDGLDKAEIEKYLQKQYQLEARVESQAKELTSLYEVTKLLAGRTINVTNQASGNNYNTKTAGIVHNEGDISGNVKIAGVYNEVAQQDFTQVAASIQQLIDQLHKTNGVTLATAQQQAAKDLATKATSDPILKDKLIQLAKFISENSAKTIVSEGVKGAIKLFLLMI